MSSKHVVWSLMLLETYERHNGEVRFAHHSGAMSTKNVEIGQLVPVSPSAVQRHLVHWENAYALLGSFETVLNTAAAHHRLLWVHPFLDENRRVARLISYATLRNALDTGHSPPLRARP